MNRSQLPQKIESLLGFHLVANYRKHHENTAQTLIHTGTKNYQQVLRNDDFQGWIST